MQHRGNIVETLVGAVVCAVAVFFAVYLYTSTGGIGDRGGYRISAGFNDAYGIEIGSGVRLSGIAVGSVTGRFLDPAGSYRAIVEMTIRDDVRLPDDSSIRIASAGLLGGNYLAITPGGSGNFLGPGDSIEYSQGAVSLIDLLGKAIFSGGNQ